MSNNSTEIELDVTVVELFAFATFKGDRDPDEARQEWQAESETRYKHRAEARETLKFLHASGGIKFRTSNSAVQQKTMDWLMTVPPRPAYGLNELT